MHDIATSLAHLQRLPVPGTAVVSVYLDTRWSDEHQRHRTRVFLARELREAREAGVAAPEDLDWIEREGRALVEQTELADAHGVALFACQALGLRDVIPARVPFPERFTVGERPDLSALAAALDEQASALVVFVDGETARIIPLHATGTDDEVTLGADVPRRHRGGGWAQLAQSGYARHIETHRNEHFEAVGHALTQVVDAQRTPRIVLAGHEDRLSEFRTHLPERVQRLVIGHVHGARWEATSAIVARAAERLDLQERVDEVADVDGILTEAAKGGRAVAGSGTLDAAHRGAIHRLYVLAGLQRRGRVCETCGALQESGASCWLCGGPTRDVDLRTALVDRVLATGGTVETVTDHAGLAAAGGMAARLHYPLGRART